MEREKGGDKERKEEMKKERVREGEIDRKKD